MSIPDDHPFLQSHVWQTGGPKADFDARRLFLEWLDLDPQTRENQTELAARIGVTTRTISMWKRDERVRGGLHSGISSKIVELMPQTIDRLQRIIEEGTDSAAVAASRALSQIHKDFGGLEEHTDVSKLSDTELRELMVDALDEQMNRDTTQPASTS